MAHPHAQPTKEQAVLKRTAALLGGTAVLRRQVNSRLDAHELLVEGLPGKALVHLLEKLVVLDFDASVESAVGMGLRTLQRHKRAPAKPLNPEQSGRTWRFAEILAKATDVFGSQREAETWLERPAVGLDQRRPIDLLATPAGAELVEDFLTRLEYGVYA
jgi:putative toxin-antitoxin system antitoxin component (TIGR02293 family)